MNCLSVDRLLDAGDLAGLPAEALAHAHGCLRCARALRAAESLEAALQRVLAAPAVTMPAPLAPAFTDAVLARVRGRDARPLLVSQPSPFPWWIDAFMQPACLLACGVLALVLWKGTALVSVARELFGEGSAAAAASSSAVMQGAAWCAPVADTYRALMAQGWQGQVAAAVVLVTLAALAGRMAFRASERLTSAFAGV